MAIKQSRLAAAKYMLTQLLLEDVMRARRVSPRSYGEAERAEEQRVRGAVERAVEQLRRDLES
jgi:hypothetical protein